MSQRILEVLHIAAPRIEVYSIDEAFLDLAQLDIQDYISWGNRLQKKIDQEIGLPVSVGVAPTKTLAKMAAGYAKKQAKTCLLDPELNQEYKRVLSETPVDSIWGIGRKLAPKLRAAGVRNALQLTAVSKAWIHSLMGVNGVRVWCELRGEKVHDFEDIKPPRKSMMVSRSFGQRVRDFHELESAAASFASKAAYGLRQHGQKAGVVGVFTYFKDLTGDSRYHTKYMPLATATSDTSEIVGCVLALLSELYDEDNSYQKVGVFMHHLSSENNCQTNLFDEKSEKERSRSKLLMKSIDDINRRFGKDTVHIASIDKKATRWHAQKKRISPAYTTEWSQLPLVYRPS